MPRTKEYGEKLREATRIKILESAVALFAEKGLTATSTKEIAKNASVSVGLMYHYYKTKDEMFDAIVADAMEEVSEFRKILREQNFKVGIRLFAEEMITEMKSGDSFAKWMAILAQSTDFDKQLIAELSMSVPVETAQLFVALIHGLCQLHLTLKEEFRVPTADMILSVFEIKYEEIPNERT
ncbi:MAG: TetR/AcrR family transcriptional regulator [Defluviitaleaceae bacterium]|nr:TetR/AcrR family transcriptional regulator [Defluviitaleaceae bacterium]